MEYVIKNLTNDMGYFFLIAFMLSQCKSFKKIIQRDEYDKKSLLGLSLIFGGIGIFGTYIGTEVEGAIANTRIVGIMAGGMLCGPLVGLLSGIIAGIHRIFISSGDITTIPCAITTIVCGIISGILHKHTNKENKWIYGLLSGFVIESLEMILILIFSRPFYAALNIVKNLYIPMGVLNAVGISILILLVQNIFEEKEEIAAKQAKLSLDIANKTLPYFREITTDSFKKICNIIKESIKADVVVITDTKVVLAYVGIENDDNFVGNKILTEYTEKVLKSGEILVLKNSKEINCINKGYLLRSGIIAPLKEGDKIIGTLKIYYKKENAISFKTKNLAIGLSNIISTQLEISKIEKLKQMATKSEIKALQTQINPHFLFNALNTIASFVRINPSKARELIINLSTFLRYNLEACDNLVDIYRELDQVKAYVEVEKARFGDRLNVVYDIEKDIDIKIPSLIIQPLVENAIKHGILQSQETGTVKIDIKTIKDKTILIVIEDDGIGIDKKIINSVYNGTMKENKIGISNVNSRLKYIYGKGLKIEQLDKGTKVYFTINKI